MEEVKAIDVELKTLVFEAYRTPQFYNVDDVIQRTVNKFANEQALKCYENPNSFPNIYIVE